MVGLLSDLQAGDKKGYFTRSVTPISYPTGFHTLDYRNGFMLKSYNENNQLVREQPSIGVVGGTFNGFIGRSGTAKTTACIQMAMNIVKPFKNSFVIHCDAEGATSYSRVKAVTGVDTTTMKEKYIIKKDMIFIEQIQEFILQIAQMKIAGGNKYKYDTGMTDEFNEPIITYEPTVIILDSLPSLEMQDADSLDDATLKKAAKGDIGAIKNEFAGDTHPMRKAKKLAHLFRHLGPVIHEANIIVFYVNHIQVKIDINPFAKTQAQTMYLKMDESLPLGISPIYYANNIFKFVSSTKFKSEEDGFDGFLSKCELIKSRTNKAGQVATLIYNQETGFDNALSLYKYAEEAGVVEGRNPKKSFAKYPDIKFDDRKFSEEFNSNPDLQYALYDSTIPILERLLSRGREDDVVVNEEEILQRVLMSMHNEGLTN